LADLVELYRLRRDDLFSKNVRYYLYSKKNTEKGPAGKMRETLKSICVERELPPERFALFHNGVTIYSAGIESGKEALRLKEPYVLNGCQTIKNAYFFKNDTKLKGKIDDEIWGRVAVPNRLIQTKSDELVRTITINNNRQNSMAVSAFRANDREQLELEERFRKAGIFYERQVGAFTNVEYGNPESLEEEYYNTRGQCVEMLDLARAVAAAAGDIGHAMHPNDLFESDTAYTRCFAPKRLRSVPFLVLLQNLEDVMGVILKKDLNLTPKGAGPAPARLKYYAICLCVRYLAKNRREDVVREFGSTLFGSKASPFRDKIGQLLRSRDSGIRDDLSRRFMTLESTNAAIINGVWETCQNALYLRKNIDVFDRFADVALDEEPSD
jgi:hypothetical protein